MRFGSAIFGRTVRHQELGWQSVKECARTRERGQRGLSTCSQISLRRKNHGVKGAL